MTEVYERISAINKRDLLHDDAPPRGGTPTAGTPEGVNCRGNLWHPHRTEPTNYQPNHRCSTIFDTRCTVIRADIAALSFRQHNANNQPTNHQTTHPTNQQQQQPLQRILQRSLTTTLLPSYGDWEYANTLPPDAVHQTHEAEPVVEYE